MDQNFSFTAIRLQPIMQSDVEPGTLAQEETSLAVGQATWVRLVCQKKELFLGLTGRCSCVV